MLYIVVDFSFNPNIYEIKKKLNKYLHFKFAGNFGKRNLSFIYEEKYFIICFAQNIITVFIKIMLFFIIIKFLFCFCTI